MAYTFTGSNFSKSICKNIHITTLPFAVINKVYHRKVKDEMKELIKKEDFCKAIKTVRDVWDCYKEIDCVLRTRNQEATMWFPSTCDAVIDLLHIMAGHADVDDMIAWFCWETNFGRDLRHRAFIAGKDLRLDTPEDLYDYLVGDLRFVDDGQETTEELARMTGYIAANLDECTFTGDKPMQCAGCIERNRCYYLAAVYGNGCDREGLTSASLV